MNIWTGDKIAEVRKLYTSFQTDSFKDKQKEVQEIIDLVNSFKLRAYLRSFILFQAIFDVNLAKQIVKNKEILLAGQKVRETRIYSNLSSLIL